MSQATHHTARVKWLGPLIGASLLIDRLLLSPLVGEGAVPDGLLYYNATLFSCALLLGGLLLIAWPRWHLSTPGLITCLCGCLLFALDSVWRLAEAAVHDHLLFAIRPVWWLMQILLFAWLAWNCHQIRQNHNLLLSRDQ